MAAPENGVTEGVCADFEIDTTHLKDTVTTSAAETAKSLPVPYPAELGDLHLASHRAIIFNENPGDRTSFEGLGFRPLNLHKSATPSPQHWLAPDTPWWG